MDRFFAGLGPGLITGCADDDPSGISTYSVAGAALGYSPLWTALVCFPLMAAVQMMCGRLGVVTGRGLAGVIRRRYPRWVLWGACLLLVTANVINIAADLGGMGAALEMVTGVTALVWTPAFTIVIIAFLFFSSYRQIAAVFKWTTLVMFAYVGTGFFAHVNWGAAIRATIHPQLAWSRVYMVTLLGILGTTISPYLFFWQTSQEVEELRSKKRAGNQTRGTSDRELRRLRLDVATGAFVSTFVMYFIILTAAATLNAHGAKEIHTASEAAEALRPFAGKAAYWLFTVGVVGTGMLGVPVLGGSTAYALAEAAAWRGSLEKKPRSARQFYSVLAIAMVAGLAINYTRLDAIRMLFWSAVVNGVLAPPLILLILLLTSDRRVMGDRVNSLPLRILGWATLALMTAASVSLLFS